MVMSSRIKNGRNAHRGKPDRIQDALALLNAAAKDKQEELYEALDCKYQEIKDTISEFAVSGRQVIDQAKKKAEEVVDSGQEMLKLKANQIDKKMHENPWVFLGGVALTSFLLGYQFHKK